MTAEITREIQGLELGMGLEFFLHCFVSLTKHCVILSGDAANAPGRLANAAELEASKRHYWVLVELPPVRFSEDVVDCTMNYNGDVTIIGHIPPPAIFEDRPISRYRRNRVQLCPTEPWVIFFGFPSPVDWCTASLTLPSNDNLVISVRKRRPPTVPAVTSSTTLVDY